jgi:hypothetical protein
MMQVNETIRAYDLAEALRGESGKFEVVTSQGARLTVTALPGHSIANLRISGETGPDQMLWIRKVADYQNQPIQQFNVQTN